MEAARYIHAKFVVRFTVLFLDLAGSETHIHVVELALCVASRDVELADLLRIHLLMIHGTASMRGPTAFNTARDSEDLPKSHIGFRCALSEHGSRHNT